MTERVLERPDVEVRFDDAEDERPHNEKRPPEEQETAEHEALAWRKFRRSAPALQRQNSEDERRPPDKASERHAGQHPQ